MKKYDLHLSAKGISRGTIETIEEMGFCRDLFANNTNCDTTTYHGTFRGRATLPNDDLWKSICAILDNDDKFAGTLEEEEYLSDRVVYFDNQTDSLVSMPQLGALGTSQPCKGEYKACDIHIGVDMDRTDQACIEFLEGLGVASFDKPKGNATYRIFTITTESLEDGHRMLQQLKVILDGFPRVVGKMKLEVTRRFFRKPSLVNTLPLSKKNDVDKWLKAMKSSKECSLGVPL